MVLIELMSRQVRLGVGLGEVRPARLAEAKAPASTTDSING